MLLTLSAGTSTVWAFEPRVPEGFFGAKGQFLGRQPWQGNYYDDEELARAAEAMGTLGMESVKVNINWPAVQPDGPNQELWDRYDRIIRALASEHVAVSAEIFMTPTWARDKVCALTTVSMPERCRPESPDTYAEFARMVIARYGRNGEFWDQNRTLPKHPITSVELWNEVNSPKWFKPEADPEYYAQMYNTARSAMRTEDPDVVAVVGGLTPAASEDPIEPGEFVDRMDTKPDAVGIHSYGATALATFPTVVNLRNSLDGLEFSDVPMFLSEWGWVTNDWPVAAYEKTSVTDAARAEIFTGVASSLGRSDCGVDQVTAHTWETNYVVRSDPEDWFGIAKVDGEATALLSQTAEAYGDMISRLGGDDTRAGRALPAPPRATIHLCDRPAPDRDGDGVEDQHDYRPTDPAVTASPQASAPETYEAPAVYVDGIGATLTATSGTWEGSPLPSFTLERWESCAADGTDCEAIPGADDRQLTPMFGRYVRAVVNATNELGAATVTSVDTGPQRIAQPSVTGTPKKGQWIHTDGGQWVATPAPLYSYQWYACDLTGSCSAIQPRNSNGARSPSLLLSAAEVGKQVYVEVTAANVYGTLTQSSAKTATVLP